MSKDLNIYLDICTQFYELSKPVAPKDAYLFYKSYASQAQGTILEPMCGTGRFLLPLIKEGFHVEGSDASHYMLSALQEKAQKMQIQPKVWHGYAHEIPENKLYALIFIPTGSLGFITDIQEMISTLQVFYDQLTDNGELVFEAKTEKAVLFPGVWRGSKHKREDGKTILLSSCSLLEENIYSFTAKFELIAENKVIQTQIEEYRIRIYSPQELLKALRDVGFTQVKICKAFDQTKSPNASDETIVYECRK